MTEPENKLLKDFTNKDIGEYRSFITKNPEATVMLASASIPLVKLLDSEGVIIMAEAMNAIAIGFFYLGKIHGKRDDNNKE